MIVAVTGGTGFIGTTLVHQLLEEGHVVKVLTRDKTHSNDRVTYCTGDLFDDHVDLGDFVRDVDVLYNCCGELTNKDIMKKLHVEGTKKLLLAASGTVNRWVQLSSVGAYGTCRYGNIKEDTLQRPAGEYERTKTESDCLVQSSGIPAVVVRPSIVFSREMPNNSLRQLASAIESGKFFYIGKRGAILNYAHVDEVAKALVLCGTNDCAIGNTYIVSQSTHLEDVVTSILVGSGLKRTFWRLPELPVRALAGFLGWSGLFPLTSARINAMTGRCTYDSSKIMEQLGFEFESTLEERFQSFACNSKNKTLQ
ncbi:MAG: nucleoside-diphosphate-sugar epimerase [Phycisphaerales bacterium]|jgi:nucleoside-diphosphate-sugar epimerase